MARKWQQRYPISAYNSQYKTIFRMPITRFNTTKVLCWYFKSFTSELFACFLFLFTFVEFQDYLVCKWGETKKEQICNFVLRLVHFTNIANLKSMDGFCWNLIHHFFIWVSRKMKLKLNYNREVSHVAAFKLFNILRGCCTQDQLCDCLFIFLKNYSTLVASKRCVL